MKKRISLFIAALACAALLGCAANKSAVKLSTQEVAEIKDWMYSARTLYNFGDYNTSKYYCEKIMEKYPDTSYARKAEALKHSVEWKLRYK